MVKEEKLEEYKNKVSCATMLEYLLAVGLGLWVWKKYPFSKKDQVHQYQIQFYDSWNHHSLLYFIPISTTGDENNYIESNLISLCRNEIFCNYLQNTGVRSVELFCVSSDQPIIECGLESGKTSPIDK